VVNLKYEDVKEETSDGVSSLVIFIWKSKTDQAGDGATVHVSETGTPICPVRWYRFFCTIRNPRAVFLFHKLGDRTDVSEPLSSSTPNFIVKKLVASIGMNPQKFGSHSCRKGGCTTAVESGVDIRLVARHGRWKSQAVMTYVKDSKDSKLSVTRLMKEDKNVL